MSEKLLFSGKTHTTSGRDGYGKSSDGKVDIKLPEPHPAAEDLFGVAWSACYMGALGVAAAQKKIKLPADPSVDAEINLYNGDSGFFPRAPQCQHAGPRPRGRARSHPRRAWHLSLLQGCSRQYRGDDQSGVSDSLV